MNCILEMPRCHRDFIRIPPCLAILSNKYPTKELLILCLYIPWHSERFELSVFLGSCDFQLILLKFPSQFLHSLISLFPLLEFIEILQIHSFILLLYNWLIPFSSCDCNEPLFIWLGTQSFEGEHSSGFGFIKASER
jgi:hypothetical protein